jgi:predicted O-methyltransferase YrrM
MTGTSARRRVTGLVPVEMRRWPYQALDQLAAVRDQRRLHADRPDVAALLSAPRDHTELRRVYERYVDEVSSWDWAVSWPTACLLDDLVTGLAPRRVLDLGSGFSTYTECWALRRNGHDAEVVSVDDSPEWLDKTRAFLAAEDLSATLVPGREISSVDGPFDLAFDDIGRVEDRARMVGTLARVMAPGGVVVLDDMNVRGYRNEVRAKLEALGWPLYSLRPATLDDKRRFAMLTVAQ